MLAASFFSFLALFLLIGLLSGFKNRKTAEDYLIASQSVPPWLVGLSAVATNNSGFMFIGMIGLTYTTGLSSIWLMIGWIIGDLCANLLCVKKIRLASNYPNVNSFGGLLAHWHGTNYHTLRRLAGVMTIAFLTVYAAAQLKAGSKATAILLDWNPATGIITSAIVVLIYSFVGGIRASIWTDAAQSFVMITGMTVLLLTGLHISGGLGGAIEQWQAISPGYYSWFPDKSPLGIALFILGWLFGGLAVLGQPHIVIRFMTLQHPEQINRMRVYYYSWFTLFYGATVVVGMLCRIVLPETGSFDAELALPSMASELLPPLFVGLVLAALFAATLSTADSLILACSAAATRDFVQGKHHSLLAAKLATFIVLSVAAGIALSGNKTVFALVLDAWGLLASAFAPLIILYSLGYHCREQLALGMTVTGVGTFLLWQYAGLGGLIYSVAPGICAGLVCFFIATAAGLNPQPLKSSAE